MSDTTKFFRSIKCLYTRNFITGPCVDNPSDMKLQYTDEELTRFSIDRKHIDDLKMSLYAEEVLRRMHLIGQHLSIARRINICEEGIECLFKQLKIHGIITGFNLIVASRFMKLVNETLEEVCKNAQNDSDSDSD